MGGQRTQVLSAGTEHVAADYTLGGNWGTTPSVSAVAADDRGGRVTVTSGSGTPGANPTVAVTFKDGAYNGVPALVVAKGGTAGDWAVTTLSESSVTFTFIGTPAASTAYTLAFVALDRN